MINENELILLISEIDLFAGLNEDIIEQLAALGTVKKYNEGESIFKEGDPGDKMFIVIDGSINLSITTANGPVIISQCARGELFGEVALIDEQERSASATAEKPSTLLEIGKAEFFLFVNQHSSFAVFILKAMCSRLRNVNNFFT